MKLFLEEQQKRVPNGHRLFHSEGGRPLCYGTLQRTIQMHLGVSPHVLRHSYATNLRLRGMDLDALAELMGHESLETTRIYATLANEELRRRYLACGLLGDGPSEPPKPPPSPVVLPGNGVEVERVRRRLGRGKPSR